MRDESDHPDDKRAANDIIRSLLVNLLTEAPVGDSLAGEEDQSEPPDTTEEDTTADSSDAVDDTDADEEEENIDPESEEQSCQENTGKSPEVGFGKRRGSVPFSPGEIESDRPIKFVADPHMLVDHANVPQRLKDAIIENYGEEFFYTTSWSFGTLKRLHKAIFFPRENVTHTIAQICSRNCTLQDVCAYAIVGVPPAGERCPIELKMAAGLYNEYVKAVSERLAKDEHEIRTDIILHNLINGLVEIDIIEMRLNSLISKEGFVIQTVTVVNEESGQVYTRDEESVAVRIKERVNARKGVLYRQLIATPEMTEKYKRGRESDLVARTAEVLSEIEKMIKVNKTSKSLPE